MPQRRITTRGHKNTEAGQSVNQDLPPPLTPKVNQGKTSFADHGGQLISDQEYQDEEDSLPVRGQEEEVFSHGTKSHIQPGVDNDLFIQDKPHMTKGHLHPLGNDDPFGQDNNNPYQEQQDSMDQGPEYLTQRSGNLGARHRNQMDQGRGGDNGRESPSHYQKKSHETFDQRQRLKQGQLEERGRPQMKEEGEEGVRPKGGINREQGRREDQFMMQGHGQWGEEEDLGQRGNSKGQLRGLRQQPYGRYDQGPQGRQQEELQESGYHQQSGRFQGTHQPSSNVASNNREGRHSKDANHLRYGRQGEEEHHPQNATSHTRHGLQDEEEYHLRNRQRPGEHFEGRREADPRPGPTSRNEDPRSYETRDEYHQRNEQGEYLGRSEDRRRGCEDVYRREEERLEPWKAKIFRGKEHEDVEMFINIIDVKFAMREDWYKEGKREKMKILYLASHLDDDALSWWSRLHPDRKRTWEEATNALKFKYNRANMRMSTERLERQRAQVALNNLRQGDMTCEEYLNTADDMYYRLGTGYNRTLAMNFVQGISNPVTQSVVNGLVTDNYSYEQAQDAFIRATRCQRETEMQKKLADKEKGKTREESVTKTLLEVQANMAKMMLDNQRMMAMMIEGQTTRINKGFHASQDSIVRTGQDQVTKSGIQGGVTCYGCGQKGHYRNECPTQANIQANSNRQSWRPQNLGRFMVGAKAGSTEVSTNAISIGEESIILYGDNESSGTLGVRVASNMVELISEGNRVIEEEVAAVSKRNRESSSSGVAADGGRPVQKKHRAEQAHRTEPDQQIGPEINTSTGIQDRPIRIPITRRRENDDPTQDNMLPVTEEQSRSKLKRKRRNPLEAVLRKPRMMENEPEWDYVKAIRDLRVDISIGQLMTVSPITRAAFAYGVIIPAAPKKKGKKGVRLTARVQDSQAATRVSISAPEALPEPTEEIHNFHTSGQVNGRTLQDVLIDGGSVVNLIPDRVARELRVIYRQNSDLQIRMATGDIWPIHYYALFEVTIAGVTAQVRAYIIAKSTTYTLLLGRRWLKQVKAKGDYKMNTYEIEGNDGIRRMIPEGIRAGPQNRVLEVEINPEKRKEDLMLPKEELEEFMEYNTSWLDESANRSLNKVIDQLGDFNIKSREEAEEGEEVTEGGDEWEEESEDDDIEEGNEEEY